MRRARGGIHLNDLLLLTDRFVKGIAVYFLLLFLMIIVIPLLVVLNHQGLASIMQPNVALPETTLLMNEPAGSDSNSQSGRGNLSPLRFGSKPLTFGWLNGTSGQVGSYNKLSVVSPLAAVLSANHPLNVVLSQHEVTALHHNNVKVWGRVALGSQTATGTHDYLTNIRRINQDIKRLAVMVQQDQLDGINIDIESISNADQPVFLHFIELLSVELHKNSQRPVLSIDSQSQINLPQSLGVAINRALAKYSDYIIFMGYDQHWAADPAPGPVTSLNWLRKNLVRFETTGLPPAKLLLGLPSYTRIWKVNAQKQTITSRAVANEYINTILTQKKMPEQWQSDIGAYFSAFNDQGNPYEVWSLDTRSVQGLLKLAQQYRLAGFGFWSLNMMSSKQWNTLAKTW